MLDPLKSVQDAARLLQIARRAHIGSPGALAIFDHDVLGTDELPATWYCVTHQRRSGLRAQTRGGSRNRLRSWLLTAKGIRL